jgi:hypothetical protein
MEASWHRVSVDEAVKSAMRKISYGTRHRSTTHQRKKQGIRRFTAKT